MKSISKYWGLIVVVLMLFGTNLCYLFTDSNVLARVIGLGFFFLLPIPIWVWILLQKQNFLLGPGNWFKESFPKSRVDFWSRILIFCFGLIWVYTASVSYIIDAIDFARNGPHVIVAEVLDTHTGIGAISNHLTLNSGVRHLSASHFARGTFQIGNTYKFFYLPLTEKIVDAELISTDKPE